MHTLTHTCLLDEENGQWLYFDGMAPPSEGGDWPNGRGRVIDPPICAQSLGGLFWPVLLYAQVWE